MDGNNPPRIGVIIRTTGERTEQLCLASVLEAVDMADVVLLRNISPPHAVYLRQFALMAERNYDYVLCLDADIVLCEGWYETVLSMIHKNKGSRWFVLLATMYDGITGNFLGRGFHLYDTQFAQLSYYFMKCSEYLVRNQHVAEHININFTSRVESNLGKYYSGLQMLDITERIILGWHGFEQYNTEIFRQYAMRRHREAGFKHPRRTPFLYAAASDTAFSPDAHIARMGWDNYQIVDYRSDIETIKETIADFLRRAGIAEKTDSTVALSLAEFRSTYNDDRMKFAQKYYNSKHYRFYKYKARVLHNMQKVIAKWR